MDTAELIALIPFAAALGVELDSAAPAEVRGRLHWSPDRCTTGGVLHGGALMAFADSVGAVCAYLNLPDGSSTTTLESKTNFFRGVRSGTVHALAQPLHVGNTVIAVQTELRDGEDRRVAHVIQTQTVHHASA